jgi:hypothetical protein
MPAIVLFVGLWAFFATFLSPDHSELASIFYCCSTLLCLAVIGLYESLARSSFMLALLSTVFLGAAVPAMVGQLGNILDFVTWAFGGPSVSFITNGNFSLLAIAVQCCLAIACVWRLHTNLLRRRFALERPLT